MTVSEVCMKMAGAGYPNRMLCDHGSFKLLHDTSAFLLLC
jgi:hypothetical protein